MLESIAPGESYGQDVPYGEILTAIVQRLMQLSSAPVALDAARSVAKLSVDEDGNVLDYDRNDPFANVALMIKQCGLVAGGGAMNLTGQADQPFSADTAHPTPPVADISSSTRVSPIRVLVVDDHILFREGVVRRLESQPDLIVVGETGSMRGAIVMARDLRPDVILMDIGLPDGTGLEATVAIMADIPTTHIIFLTVHDDDGALFAAIRAGAMGYLSKDVGPAELFSKLRGVVRGEAAMSPVLARRILEEFSRLPAPPQAKLPDATRLTAREIEIVRALARGATNLDIAKQLVISENTVRTHVQNVLAKLRLHSRRDVAEYARAQGL